MSRISPVEFDHDDIASTGHWLSHLCVSDIDECEEELDTCDVNAICSNTPGSFACNCKRGYLGNGFKCEGKGSIEI